MNRLIVLNDCYVDASKVSYISKIDTKVFASINVRVFYFKIIVDGHEVDIEGNERTEVEKLRLDLINSTSVVLIEKVRI